MSTTKTVWIGLVSVIPNAVNNILNTSNVAYVNALAFTDGHTSFSQIVAEKLATLNLSLLDVEDVEKLEDRILKFSVDSKLLKLAGMVRIDGVTRFGDFHIST